MEIKLDKNQITKFLEDEFIDIQIGDYRVYLEIDHMDKNPFYFEFVRHRKGNIEKKTVGVANNIMELEKLKPKRPEDPSYYHNDPLCPNCRTYMIYKFEHCPKCGQKLDWSEK